MYAYPGFQLEHQSDIHAQEDPAITNQAAGVVDPQQQQRPGGLVSDRWIFLGMDV